jgi:hypothetical protein
VLSIECETAWVHVKQRGVLLLHTQNTRAQRIVQSLAAVAHELILVMHACAGA